MKKKITPERVFDYPKYKVVSLREMSNAYMTFPKGTVFRFTSEPTINKHLIVDKPCTYCGVQGRITVKGNRLYFEREFEFVLLNENTEKETPVEYEWINEYEITRRKVMKFAEENENLLDSSDIGLLITWLEREGKL